MRKTRLLGRSLTAPRNGQEEPPGASAKERTAVAASRVAARRAVQARASGFPPRAVPDEHPRCVTRLSAGSHSLSSSLALLSCLSLRLHSVARAELDLEAGMYVRGMCRYALDGHAVVVAVLALVLAVRESCGGIDDRMLCRSRGTFWQRDDAASCVSG